MVPEGYDRVVESADRAVNDTANRVLQNRVTGAPGGSGGVGVGGTVPPPPAIEPPPGLFAIDPGYVTDPALQRCLEQVRDLEVNKTYPYKSLRMALVDLTGGRGSPAYAGVNDRIQTQTDSLPQIGVMFAAFLLRDLVQGAANNVNANSGTQLLKWIETAWQPVWENRFPTRKSDSPKLTRIFEIRSGGPQRWTVNFKSASHGNDAALDAIAQAGTAET